MTITTSSPTASLRVHVTSGDVHASLLRPHQMLVSSDDAARFSMRSHSLCRLRGVESSSSDPSLLQLVCDRRAAHDGGLRAGVVQLHASVLEALGLRDGDTALLEMAPVSDAATCRAVRRVVLAVVMRSPLRTTTTSSSSLSISTNGERSLESIAAATYALLPESVRSGLVDLKRAVARQLVAMFGGMEMAIGPGNLMPLQLMGETFIFRIIQIEHEQVRFEVDPLIPAAMEVEVLGSSMGRGIASHLDSIVSKLGGLEIAENDEDGELGARLWAVGFCGYTSLIKDTLFHIFLNFPNHESTFRSDALAIQSLASRGLILRGVPGVGKSLALRVLDSELQRRGVSTWRVDAMSLLMEYENSKVASAYEYLQTKCRHFLPTLRLQQLDTSASVCVAGVVLIDDLHVLFQSTNGQDASDASDGDQSGLMLMPLGSALLRLLDSMADQPGGDAHRLCIVGTGTSGDRTEDGGAIPPVAWRSGRFDKQIEIIVPTEAMRREVLTRHLTELPLATGAVTDSLAGRLAALTGGYVAKDLVRICRGAYVHAFTVSNQEAPPSIPAKTMVTWDHLVLAQRQIKPSQLQQLNVASPSTDVETDGIGPFAGYTVLQKELGEFINWKFHPSKAMQHLGVANASGLLLHGPSGCGKSLLVKALAANAKVNFVSVKSSELLSKYFGDSERAVRQLFARARAASPCLLFFDEFDSIAHKRSFGGADAGGGDSSGVYARILSTFLNEMDGVGGSRHRAAEVLIVAATNRIDALDAALVRPGRIDKSVALGYPQRDDAEAILAYYTRKMPLANDVDLTALAGRATGSRPFTGADLAAVCKEAAFRSLRETIDAQCVRWEHFTASWDQRADL